MPGMNIMSVNINTRSYSISSDNETSSEDNDTSNNHLIVGLSVGITGGVLLVVGAMVAYYAYQKIHANNRIGVPMSNTEKTAPRLETIAHPPVSYSSPTSTQVHVTKYLNPSQPQSNMYGHHLAWN